MNPAKEERNASILSRRKAGWSVSRIAAAESISHARVHAILRREGMTQRVGRPRELPPMTPQDEWLYAKMRRHFGAKEARRMMFNGKTDNQLLTDPKYANQAWNLVIREGL